LEGPLTIYQQHLRFGYKQKNTTCPNAQFLQDLTAKVQQWQSEGNEVIIMADMNEDVTSKAIQQFCKDTQLVEAIKQLHGPAKVPTHQWGSTAIDSIFIPAAIQAELKGGFLQLGEVTISNHRAVWLDILAHLFEMAQTQGIT